MPLKILAGLLVVGMVGGIGVKVRYQQYYVPSGAMEDTIRINDRLVVDQWAYKSANPKNGDIAIFKAPKAALLNSPSQSADVDFIKRVVGVPGQTVEIINKQLRVDGKTVPEPFAKWKDYKYDMKIVGGTVYSREYLDFNSNEPGLWTVNLIPVSEAGQDKISRAKSGKIPAGKYLMLGDHRSNSNDSHVWGLAERNAFRGRATHIIWPLSHRKKL